MKQPSATPRVFQGWTVVNEVGPLAMRRIVRGDFHGIFETREQAQAARDKLGYGAVVSDTVLVFPL